MTDKPISIEEVFERLMGVFPCDCPSCAQDTKAAQEEAEPHSLRAEILDAAAACVLRDRQKTHGSPEQSFTMISKLWSAFLGVDIQPHEVCSMMGLLKIARSKGAPENIDNWMDTAGYAACGGELAMGVRPITMGG